MPPFKILRKSDTQNEPFFDEKFVNFHPNHSVDARLTRTHYTKSLLAAAANRQSEFWMAIAVDSQEPIARIGADITDTGASIGFFEAQLTELGLAAAQHLVAAAIEWLAARGASEVHGPMDLNSWFNYRFKVRASEKTSESAPDADHPWEPSHPEAYATILRNAGFEDSLLYSSYFFELESSEQWKLHLKHLENDRNRTLAAGFKIRKLQGTDNVRKDIHSIFEVSNVAFANHPMFESIPFELFCSVTLPALTHFNAEPSRICFDKNGKAVAFMFAFLINGLIVYKSVAVLPEFQSLGISNAMTAELCDFGLKNNITNCVGALLREGNKSEMIGRSFEKVVKTSGRNDYILLRKAIS